MKKKAFTLIELLIVIAIIAILATIIIVALSNARPKANRSTALESINGALKAAQTCIVDGGTLNAYAAGGSICATATVAVQGNWPVANFPTGSATTGYTFAPTVNTATGVTALTVTNPTGVTGQNITCSTVGGFVTSCK